MNRALLVGINYPNTQHALRGCVNDVLNMEHILKNVYNFTEIHKLIDSEATTNNILSKFEEIIKKSKKGDKVFFHFSGHGSQIIDLTGDEEDGKDEIICPIDLNWKDKVIRDDDLNNLVKLASKDVDVIIVLDCCHSGDGMDFVDQYQPNINLFNRKMVKGIARYMEPPSHLKPKKILNRGLSNTVKVPLHTGIMISGCRSHQTSADAFIDGIYTGACTYFMLKILQHNKWKMSYKDLTYHLNLFLGQHKFTQQPELSGIREKFDNLFILEDNNDLKYKKIPIISPKVKRQGGVTRLISKIKESLRII